MCEGIIMSRILKKIAIMLTAAVTVSMCGTAAGAQESPWAKPAEKPAQTTSSGNSDKADKASETSASDIHLSRSSVEMAVGDKVSIRLTGAEGKVKWTVSDSKIFSYSKGVVTAKGAGKGTLTAEYGGKKYRCSITVNKKVDGFGADTYSLKLPKGGSGVVKINTAGKTVSVMADNANICEIKCSVLVNGAFDLTVTAKEKGSCNLIVYDVNNKKSRFAIKLTVTEQVSAGSAKESREEAAADDVDFIDEVIRLCNEEREAAGLSPLEKSDSLTDAAAVRAGELPRKFSHTRPDGSSCFTAFPEKSKTKGENIAMGYSNPEQVVSGWMNSPGHKANILNPDFTKIGVGYNENGSYWVQVFVG